MALITARKDYILTEKYQDIAWYVGDSSLAGESLRGGDIVPTRDGDFASRTAENDIIESVKRLITTPSSFYERWVLDVDGLKALDIEYGNPAFNYIAEPLSSSSVRRMETGIKFALRQEPRITNVFVSIGNVQAEQGQISFVIRFTIPDSSITLSFNLNLVNNDNFVLEPIS